jgi:hypothetical protein
MIADASFDTAVEYMSLSWSSGTLASTKVLQLLGSKISNVGARVFYLG